MFLWSFPGAGELNYLFIFFETLVQLDLEGFSKREKRVIDDWVLREDPRAVFARFA